ncbi:MAG: DUF1385 domain-containing protein [Deltaproteobacteria bacterium]|nr:DUF1385 domain-containing protein [Deltaproteobacteria bacterium]
MKLKRASALWLLQARPYIGGQAVLEGVMMRSPKSFVVAVRRPDGQIVVREQAWETLLGQIKPLRWPFLRGVIVLVESLWNGMSALNFSAEQAMPEEEKDPKAKGESPAVGPRQATGKEKAALGATLVLSLVLGLALFVGAPHLLTWLLGVALKVPLDTNSFAFHAIDGVIKAAIFIAYLWGISRLPDIRRVFEYHGAEHKAIWAYESEQPLTPESAAKFTTLHPRCGTSFLLLVLAMSILMFALVFPFVPKVSETAILNHLAMIGIKVPLMFPLAGLSYELQRLSARKNAPQVLRWLVAPGLWLQRITTREPSKEQLEIAVLALSRALAREEGKTAEDGVKLFRDFDGAVAVP